MKTAARVFWGALYPMQSVNPKLAKKAGVPIPAHEWDRHHYEPVLPGFGGNDSMDWRAFMETLMQRGFNGPLVIENEGANSAHTGNLAATLQGFKTTVLCLAPLVWPLQARAGYQFDDSKQPALIDPPSKDVPAKTMADL